MKHLIKLSGLLEVKSIDNQECVQIKCRKSEVTALALALCLLRDKLIQSIIIVGAKGSKLEISQYPGKFSGVRISKSAGQIDIALPQVSIDMVLHFYLIYYRDGLADVSHVDIETDERATTSGYLTFFAADSKEPITAKELEDHLRDAE